MTENKLYEIRTRDNAVIKSTKKLNGYKNEPVMLLIKVTGKEIAQLQAKDEKYINVDEIKKDMRLAIGLNADYDHSVVDDVNTIKDISPTPTADENTMVMEALKAGKTEAEALADKNPTVEQLMKMMQEMLSKAQK